MSTKWRHTPAFQLLAITYILGSQTFYIVGLCLPATIIVVNLSLSLMCQIEYSGAPFAIYWYNFSEKVFLENTVTLVEPF